MGNTSEVLGKVPEVTFGFWVVKILATTLGETGGDSVTMSWLHADAHPHNGGYLIGSAIFLAVLVAAAVTQIRAEKFKSVDLLAGHRGLDHGGRRDGRFF